MFCLMKKPLTLLFSVFIFLSMGLTQTEVNNVFGSDQVMVVDITFYDSNFWSILIEEYEGGQDYIPARITSNTGTTILDSVGIRLKGNSSMNLPGDKKPFKVDFKRFIPGHSFNLLKKLNNGFKDTKFVREKILNRKIDLTVSHEHSLIKIKSVFIISFV